MAGLSEVSKRHYVRLTAAFGCGESPNAPFAKLEMLTAERP
jgi:hypothetical protein